jgi:hypothetical protein
MINKPATIGNVNQNIPGTKITSEFVVPTTSSIQQIAVVALLFIEAEFAVFRALLTGH